MGPTASGKTALAQYLYSVGDIELISVDSAMVYRGCDIGSGKPTPFELQQAPHHLVDICEPWQPFDVGQFIAQVQMIINDIHARGKLPICVGGTQMYFHALQRGLSELPATEPAIRETVLAQAEQLGWPAMHQELRQHDPATAERLAPNDAQRIGRALEVFYQTRTPLSQWQKNATKNHYQFLNIALIPKDTPRSVLHQRIEQRFEQMLEQGLIDEVQQLRSNAKNHTGLPAIRAVGYRQVWEHLAGDINFDDMVVQAQAATRQLAKRQLTWLRSWPNVNELDFMSPNLKNEVVDLIRQFTEE